MNWRETLNELERNLDLQPNSLVAECLDGVMNEIDPSCGLSYGELATAGREGIISAWKKLYGSEAPRGMDIAVIRHRIRQIAAGELEPGELWTN